jgi:3-deoxy-D-manno-octulosonic-acid transferase
VYFLYSLLLTVGFVVLLPRFAIDALRTRKYVTGLRQRLGNLPKLPPSDKPLIWLHCVSVGETEAARPLVRALGKTFPTHRLVVSTTTVTGQQVAQRIFAENADAVFYFPIDWAWTVRRVLRALQPSAVLIMETELWPNLMRQCRRQSIPVALVNGRISTTSFSRYKKIRSFMTCVLNDLTMAVMQSEKDVARIRELGMPGERTVTCGNLKFDSAESSGTDSSPSSLVHERFGFGQGESLIVAASTHAPEEEVVLSAFKQIKRSESGQRARLLIAPRQTKRFGEVAKQIEISGFRWARRSADPAPADATCDVVLLDSIGELRDVFALADVAFIGGSIASHGGHNILEAAAEGVCVITGPHTDNFTAVMKAFLAEDAVVQLPDVSLSEAHGKLATAISKLLENDARRLELSQRAKTVCNRNRGATQRTINIIADLLASRASVNESVPFSAVHLNPAK